jgi:hypothetical protein
MIRLETSKKTGIDNDQDSEISTFQRNWSAEIPKLHPNAKPRTGMSSVYNCHGLTFASRRTGVLDPAGLRRILKDDQWEEVKDVRDVLPGDIVVYFSDEGDANHSGIVVACEGDLYLPIVCSKWGHAGEYLHQLSDCPSLYGPVKKFYRCRL